MHHVLMHTCHPGVTLDALAVLEDHRQARFGPAPDAQHQCQRQDCPHCALRIHSDFNPICSLHQPAVTLVTSRWFDGVGAD